MSNKVMYDVSIDVIGEDSWAGVFHTLSEKNTLPERAEEIRQGLGNAFADTFNIDKGQASQNMDGSIWQTWHIYDCMVRFTAHIRPFVETNQSVDKIIEATMRDIGRI